MFHEGHQVMEHALALRDENTAEFAARWMEEQGISYELALIALIGLRRARVLASEKVNCK
jgi:hypothetical protein